MLPNWIISGSFSNWGAPPEIVMTVAMVSALRIVADSVAANDYIAAAGGKVVTAALANLPSG